MPTTEARTDAERRIQTTCLLIIATVAIGAALYWLRPVMIPFVLALFIVQVLTPVIAFLMRRLRVPRWLAIVLTIVIAIVGMSLLWGLIATSVNQMSENADDYGEQIKLLVGKVKESQLFARLPIDGEQLNVEAFLPEDIQGAVMKVTGAITSILSQGMLVLIFVLFMLAGGSVPATGLRGEAEARVQRYLATKVVVSGITGTTVGITLAILGVDLALVFGLLTFLLNFIPNIGSLIATALPLPVAIVSPDATWLTVILVLAIPGGIQFAVGNVIEPKIMGESLDLNPIVILISLILWGMMWGLVGMLLAVPITAVIKIYLERLEMTRPVAMLLSGKPKPKPG